MRSFVYFKYSFFNLRVIKLCFIFRPFLYYTHFYICITKYEILRRRHLMWFLSLFLHSRPIIPQSTEIIVFLSIVHAENDFILLKRLEWWLYYSIRKLCLWSNIFIFTAIHMWLFIQNLVIFEDPSFDIEM